jgi:glyoxylase-like metal-dependent hydrolase (beta-lactamase superfamily II)
MDMLWGEMNPIPQEQLRVVAHGETIYLEDLQVKAWHTPGHAVHHLVWQIGDNVFTGDVAGVKIGKGIVVPPCPPPDINVEDWLQSIRLLSSLKPSQLFLTHFGAVSEDIPHHLLDLEKRLLDWANWIKPHFDAQTPAETIVPIFEEYVQQQLVEGGANSDDLEKYAAANPAHMSVAGLLRYWAKKNEQ